MFLLRSPPTIKMFRTLYFTISFAFIVSPTLAICSDGSVAIGVLVEPDSSQELVVSHLSFTDAITYASIVATPRVIEIGLRCS